MRSYPTILETERLALRQLTEDDVGNLLRIFSDPVTMRYYPGTKDRDETMRWVRWNLISYEQHGHGLWAAVLKDSGDFAGQCGLVVQRDVAGVDEVEIGYLFVRAFWNCGLATEAAAACRDYGFGALHLSRLVSLIDPRNLPSKRVAEKIGMTSEKRIQRWQKDIEVYRIEP